MSRVTASAPENLRDMLGLFLSCVACTTHPAPCALCRNPVPDFSEIPICKGCWSEIPTQRSNCCARCGEDLFEPAFRASSITPDTAGYDHCRACRLAPPMFVRAVSFCVYEGAIRKALHALKYDGMVPASKQLGKLLGKALDEFAAESGPNLPAEMLIVPVPLYRGRKYERGFNQAQALAVAAMRHLAHTRPEWKLKLAENGLTRRSATRSQAGLTPRQRRQNLRGAFLVSDAEAIRGRSILLIDDIYTTGATARACSKVLMETGAASVYVATVARAQRRVPQQIISRAKYLRRSISDEPSEYERISGSSNSYTVH